ncbi:hypothetical protein BKA64DRAFT_641623 [Cadophora sp. MPI-SDFR-AT-0126]|nr:hypothetical protein BKA64DRAFT_641623 [Leotiomycetes sp. MPI-SDFR-AT-0126]
MSLGLTVSFPQTTNTAMSDSDSNSWSLILEESSDDELNTSDDEGFTKIDPEHNIPPPKPARKELAPQALFPANIPTREPKTTSVKPSRIIEGSLNQAFQHSTTVSKTAVAEGSKEDARVEDLQRKYGLGVVRPIGQEKDPRERRSNQPVSYSGVGTGDPTREMNLQRSVPPQFIEAKTVGGRERRMNHHNPPEPNLQVPKHNQYMAPVPREATDLVLQRGSDQGVQTFTQRMSSITKGLDQIKSHDRNRDPLEGLVPQVSGGIGTQMFTFFGPPAAQSPPRPMVPDALSQVPRIVGPSGQATAPFRPVHTQLGPMHTKLGQTQPQLPHHPSFYSANMADSGIQQPHPHWRSDGFDPYIPCHLSNLTNSSVTDKHPVVRPGPFRPRIAASTDPLKNSVSQRSRNATVETATEDERN